MSKSEESLKALIAFLEANDAPHDKADEVLAAIKNAPSLEVLRKCNELGARVEESKGSYSDFMNAAEDFISFFEKHSEELDQRYSFYKEVKDVYEFNLEQSRLVRAVNEALEEEGYLR